jgi:hypothetical protein
MEDILELENKLKKAKEAEKQATIQQNFERDKKQYEGCWGTHKICRFDYPGKGVELYFCRNSNFRVHNGNTICTHEIIGINTSKNNFRFQCDTYNNYGFHTYSFQQFKHKIEESLFETVKNQVSAYLENGVKGLEKEIKNQHETITNGDYGRERSEKELLLKSGIDVIELPEDGYESIMQFLNWKNHPLLIGNLLVNNQYSKLIIESIIQDLFKSAGSWGGGVADRDYPRALKLQEFVKNTNWKL